MKEIKITETAKWNGQDMAWTETPTHMVNLKKGDILQHVSSKKLNSFLSKESCFMNRNFDINSFGYSQYVYQVELLEDMAAQGYSNDDEVRFEITSENAKIFLVGKVNVLDTYSTKEITDR